MECAHHNIEFLPTARREFGDLPTDIQEEFLKELQRIARGMTPIRAKVLQGFKGRHVMELIARGRSGTYRLIYTNILVDPIQVLMCFQKKSSTGIGHSTQVMKTIRQRLQQLKTKGK